MVTDKSEPSARTTEYRNNESAELNDPEASGIEIILTQNQFHPISMCAERLDRKNDLAIRLTVTVVLLFGIDENEIAVKFCDNNLALQIEVLWSAAIIFICRLTSFPEISVYKIFNCACKFA